MIEATQILSPDEFCDVPAAVQTVPLELVEAEALPGVDEVLGDQAIESTVVVVEPEVEVLDDQGVLSGPLYDLYMENLGLADYVAERYYHRGIPHKDLKQVAYLALLKAVRRFEPERNLEFSTFAVPTIAGEIKRYFRDMGWGIKLPRKVQNATQIVRNINDDFIEKYKRYPTTAELAEAADMDVELVRAVQKGYLVHRTSSIDAILPSTNKPLADCLGDVDAAVEIADEQLLINDLLQRLDERTQKIVTMYYIDRLTQTQIGEQFGLNQMRICRILKKAVKEMQTHARESGILG